MMKKILLLMMIAALVFSCKTKQPLTSTRALETVNVGAAPNDGTGDPLRTAFQKINTAIGVMNDVSLDQATGATGTGNLVYSASPTLTGTVTLPTGTAASINDVHDTIQSVRDNAVLGLAYEDYEGGSTGNDYYLTPDQVRGLIATGGEGVLTKRTLQFRVDDTGAPATDDSTLTHSLFANNVLGVYRDGEKLTRRFTATNTRTGYRLNSSTITVNPVFQANEDWIIDIDDPITQIFIALEGEESTLTDSLVVFYSADEASGSSVSNVVNPGTVDATMWTNYTSGEVGIYNLAKHIGYMGSMTITAGSLASPRHDDFSVSMWFKLDADSVPNQLGRDEAAAPAPVNNNVYLWCQKHTATMPDGSYYSHSLYIDGSSADSNKVIFTTYNNDVTPVKYTVTSSVKINSDQWYCVTAVNPGNGQDLVLYINGADVSTSAGTFTGTIFNGLSTTYFGNVNFAYEYSFPGYIDEMGIWKVGLTSAEALEFYEAGKTYPW